MNNSPLLAVLRIGSANTSTQLLIENAKNNPVIFSLVAQLVEQTAVNRQVEGSEPS